MICSVSKTDSVSFWYIHYIIFLYRYFYYIILRLQYFNCKVKIKLGWCKHTCIENGGFGWFCLFVFLIKLKKKNELKWSVSVLLFFFSRMLVDMYSIMVDSVLEGIQHYSRTLSVHKVHTLWFHHCLLNTYFHGFHCWVKINKIKC